MDKEVLKNIKDLEKNAKKYGKNNPKLYYEVGKVYKDLNKPKVAMKWFELGHKNGHEESKEELLNIDDLGCYLKLEKKYKFVELYYKIGCIYKNKNQMHKSLVYFWSGCKLEDPNCCYEYAMDLGKYGSNQERKAEYLVKATKAGHKEAEKELLKMKPKYKNDATESENKNITNRPSSSKIYTMNSNWNVDLFEPYGSGSRDQIFLKQHTIVKCPACKGELELQEYTPNGELYNEYITVYDKGTSSEHYGSKFNIYTKEGQAIVSVNKCKKCGYEFKTTRHTILKEKEKESFRNMLKSYGRETELHAKITIEHESISPCDDELKKFLKKSGGKFDGKLW